MTPLQERAVVVLWARRQFNTAEIADLIGAPEHEVERLTSAARETAREIRRAEGAVSAVVFGDWDGAA